MTILFYLNFTGLKSRKEKRYTLSYRNV